MGTLCKLTVGWIAPLCLVAAVFTMVPDLSHADGYGNSLKGVKGISAVFDVSLADPKMANIVFWAVKNVYEESDVKALSGKPAVAVVFHGGAVKLLSSDKMLFSKEQWPEVEKFQQTLRKMKADGVNLEVCMYAVKVVGVDTKTLMPEIDQVGNGFVSVVGYQMQGYGVVRIP